MSSRNRLNTFSSQSFHWLVIPLIASLMVMWPTVKSGLGRLQPDYGDVLFNLYIFEHVFKHFSSLNIFNHSLLWSPEFYWPIADVFTWSDHLIGPSVIYAPWRLFLDPYQSYLGWIITTLILNYISIRWALRKIATRSPEIFISAIALTASFNPAVTIQISHPQMLSLYIFGPLLILWNYALSTKTEELKLDQVILLMALTLFNGFFNIYLLVYGALCTLIVLFLHIATRLSRKEWDIRLGKNLKAFSIFLILTIGAIAYIYIPYLSALGVFGQRSTTQIIENLPKAASWLFNERGLLLPAPFGVDFANSNPNLIYGQEQSLFPGWFFLITLIYSIGNLLINRHKNRTIDSKRNQLRWLFTTAFLIIVTMNFHGFSLWTYVMNLIPGASALRASSRVVMIIIIFGSAFIALSSEEWSWELSLHYKIKFFTQSATILFAFLSIWIITSPSFSLKDWRLKTKRMTQQLIKNPQCDVFWLSKSLKEPWGRHIQAMHISMRTGIPTPNGVSGHSPKEGWPAENPSVLEANHWIQKTINNPVHKLVNRTEGQYTLCEINADNVNSSPMTTVVDDFQSKQKKSTTGN